MMISDARPAGPGLDSDQAARDWQLELEFKPRWRVAARPKSGPVMEQALKPHWDSMTRRMMIMITASNHHDHPS
jgi:hypothetical protein